MICVVDASVAVKWFAHGDWATREDHIDAATALLQACQAGDVDFFQSPHFLAEVAAVLTRLTPDIASECVADLAAMHITWATPTEALEPAVALAAQLNHHLFDTWYHALALAHPRTTFITADRRYFNKAHHLGQIVWLPDWANTVKQ